MTEPVQMEKYQVSQVVEMAQPYQMTQAVQMTQPYQMSKPV